MMPRPRPAPTILWRPFYLPIRPAPGRRVGRTAPADVGAKRSLEKPSTAGKQVHRGAGLRLTAPWPHGVVTTLPARRSPTSPSVPIANARRRPSIACDALVLSMLGFGRQFLPPTFNQKALRSSSGSLAKFTANRRASSRVSRFGRRAMRRSDTSGIGGEAEVRGLRVTPFAIPSLMATDIARFTLPGVASHAVRRALAPHASRRAPTANTRRYHCLLWG
jgi:hypothetical protein